MKRPDQPADGSVIFKRQTPSDFHRPDHAANAAPARRVAPSRREVGAFGLCIALFCLALAPPPEATAQEATTQRGDSSTITAGIPQNWPPYYSTDADGKPAGFSIDIFDAVAARAGYRVSYIPYPTIAAANEAGAKGLVDTQPNIGDIPSRRKKFTFTPPVQTFNVVIFVREETQNISGIADLDGHRVAVIATNVGRRLIKQRPAARPVEFQGIQQALFELLAGTVDALIYPEPIVLNLARQAGVSNRIKTTGTPLLEVKRAIAVHPSRMEIHKRLSAAVTAFVGSPEYQKIYVSWFSQPQPYWSVERVLWWTAGLIVLIVLGFLVFHYTAIMRLNRALEARIEDRTAELQQAQEGLLRAERLSALGEITGTVAHELRNPLGTITTSFEVIRNKAATAGLDLGDTLERIQRNIDRCAGIISDLLDYARPDNLQTDPIDLNTCLAQIVEEYAFPGTVAVETDLGIGDHLVAVDREQFRRVVINLLDNACQAITQAGEDSGCSGRVRITSRTGPDRVSISVIDDGPGIDPDDRNRILEPLFSTKSFGIGLGLSNVQRIVTNHGGELTIESEPGRGTTVTISLPLPETGNQRRTT